jgi:hypothetical protein
VPHAKKSQVHATAHRKIGLSAGVAYNNLVKAIKAFEKAQPQREDFKTADAFDRASVKYTGMVGQITNLAQEMADTYGDFCGEDGPEIGNLLEGLIGGQEDDLDELDLDELDLDELEDA